MKQSLFACGIFGALLLACGCGKEKAEVPTWLKGDGKNGKDVAKNSPEALKRDLEGKIKKLDNKIAALQKDMGKLKERQKDLATKLNKDHGIHSMEDARRPKYKDNEDVQQLMKYLLKNQDEQVKDQELLKQYRRLHVDATETKDALERQIDRAKAGITEKELEDLTVTIRKIDERLSDAEAARKDDVTKDDQDLDKILKGKD
jgi:hypothetical protein